MTITVAEARSRLPELLRRTEQGEEFVITRRGKPVGVLAAVPSRPSLAQRRAVLDRMAARLVQQPVSDLSGAELIRRMRDEGY